MLVDDSNYFLGWKINFKQIISRIIRNPASRNALLIVSDRPNLSWTLPSHVYWCIRQRALCWSSRFVVRDTTTCRWFMHARRFVHAAKSDGHFSLNQRHVLCRINCFLFVSIHITRGSSEIPGRINQTPARRTCARLSAFHRVGLYYYYSVLINYVKRCGDIVKTIAKTSGAYAGRDRKS